MSSTTPYRSCPACAPTAAERDELVVRCAQLEAEREDMGMRFEEQRMWHREQIHQLRSEDRWLKKCAAVGAALVLSYWLVRALLVTWR